MDPVKTFIEDIKNFRNNDEISDKLYNYVWSEPGVPRMWYKKLSDAMKDQEKTLDSPEKVSSFVMKTVFGLFRHHTSDVEAFLKLHKLECTPGVLKSIPLVKPDGAPLFQMTTLEVDRWRIGDGDGFIVTTVVSESDMTNVPERVIRLMGDHKKYTELRNRRLANQVQSDIQYDEYGKPNYYRLETLNKRLCLMRSYKIRLKGIDAPELKMDYGVEARDELRRAISNKRVIVTVFKIDPNDRCISDVFCDGNLVQEILLKKGAAWHYPRFDNRKKFKTHHDIAKAKKIGLWWYKKPKAPWDWKADERRKLKHRFAG